MDNGGFYESVNYLDFPMHEYLKFARAHQCITGRPSFADAELMQSIGNFFLNTYYPSDKKDYHVGFGDTDGHSALYTPINLLAYGVDMPELRWYVRNCLSEENDLMVRICAYHEIYELPAAAPTALSVCYGEIGWAIFRDSYKNNSTMLAVKCGDTWNHAHADSAHFILYRHGEPQIYDTLTCSYSDKIYIDYFVESEAHNVLLFEGKGQDVRDNYKNHARNRGKLYNYTDDEGFRYVVADGTGPMSRYFRKHHRHFLWLNGFVLIYDDVECYDNGEVNFLLHAKEKNPFVMLTPCTVTEREGYVRKDGKVVPVTYKSYNRRTDDEGHVKFVSVLVLDETLTPVMEELENAYKVTCGDTVVYVNCLSDGKIMHRNCINTLDGIVTDAELLVHAGDRYGVANGSIVRHDGVNALDTLSRVTGWTDHVEQ